ncbi:pro-resilin-like [Chelonus insularis]|uniref:pro-resilin-like n=1 Tax=Chelonus insularis TaxID=460826 RepID=UPI00158DF0FD|nr:pro-resilin-like [Chelonus insularis]
MTHIQIINILLALYCVKYSVLAGLLPEGNNGYQYNRPSGGAFSSSNVDPNRRGYPVDTPERFGLNPITTPGANVYDFGGRPTTSYGAPGFGGFGSDIGFSRRPVGAFNVPGGYNTIGNYQGRNGVLDYNGISDAYRNPFNIEDNRPRPYSFQYEVRDPPSGNDYGQQETSDGNVVQGEYRVLLPDSRTQIVKYTADNVNGYNADVQYEGQAQFPRPGAASGYQFPGTSETPYQPSFGLIPYQGRGNYNGPSGGGFTPRSNSIFGSGGGVGVGTGPGNQYLPPGGGYGK